MNQNQAQFSFLRSLRRLRSAFWRRRVAHWLVRTAWLVLLVPTVYMAGYLWLDWKVRLSEWLIPMAVVGLLSLLWAVRPIRLKKVAHRLDRRLELSTQLITAFEVSRSEQKAATNSDNAVADRLLAETVELLIKLRRRVRAFDRNFWLETHTLIAVAALLGAMLTLDALSPRFPEASPVGLPTVVPEPVAEEVIPPDARLFPPPFTQEVQVQTLSRAELEQALEALADALRDQAITRAAAEAIDRGDLQGAAEELRRLADQLGDLSEQARSELGDALQEAADNAGDNAPTLTNPLQTGSQALDENSLGQAAQALSELADALESLDEAPQESAQVPSQTPPEAQQPEAEGQPQEEQADQTPPEEEAPAEQAEQPAGSGDGTGDGNDEGPGADQPTEAERLAVEGQPLELESDPDLIDEDLVLQPSELDAQANGDRRTEDSPFARGSANAATDLGPDPLTYPWDQREVIRRYFTP